MKITEKHSTQMTTKHKINSMIMREMMIIPQTITHRSSNLIDLARNHSHSKERPLGIRQTVLQQQLRDNQNYLPLCKLSKQICKNARPVEENSMKMLMRSM